MRWYSVFVTTTLVGFKSTQKVIIWSFPTWISPICRSN
jgi:hypothetical protein